MPPLQVNTGLIDLAMHPPLGVLRPFLDYYGPYSGNTQLSTWSETPGPVFTPRSVENTFGVHIDINGPIPIGWGHYDGWVSELGELDTSVYVPPLGQLVVVHRYSTGLHIVTQIATLEVFPALVMWDTALPALIGLKVAPGIALDLQFLLVSG